MPSSIDKEKIDELLTRGVDTVYPRKEDLKKLLLSGKRLRLYNGIDPTGKQLTLGHTVVLRKLRQFQDLGHEVILLVGSFTAMIGDPTGKEGARKPLTRKQVEANAKNYKKQASKVLRFSGKNAVKMKYNGTWWDSMTMKEFLPIAGQVSALQMLERDMFQVRIKKGGTVALHELLYPLFQGYDSVVMDVDAEVGGTDQMFNMMVGRDLVKSMKNKEKFVITMKLLTDARGVKIGKSEGNVIALDDKPEDLFGKIMALSDEVILPTFEMCTDVSLSSLKKIGSSLHHDGDNPMVVKQVLAHTIVRMYHGEGAADKAVSYFSRVFKKNELPRDLPTIAIDKNQLTIDILDALVIAKFVSSRSEARRVIEQGGVEVDGKRVQDFHLRILPGSTIKKGSRFFVKVV